MGSFWGLLHSGVMLLALCFVYDTFGVYAIGDKRLRDCISGVLVGVIGIAVMLTPWALRPGVFFDTRWVLLSLSGLFFGFVPTAIAVLVTGAFRLYQGGPGAFVGTVVIVVTACVGLLWRIGKEKRNQPLGWLELYVFGVVVQLAMLSCMFLMPADMRMLILAAVAPPILTLYPLITLAIGLILKRQEARRDAERELVANRKALTRERGLLRGVIDSIPDLIFFKNTEGRYLGCNSSFEVFTGREEASLLGKTDAELFGEDRAALFETQETEVLASQAPASREDWVVGKGGNRVLLDTLETPFKGLDGVLHGLVGVSRDITERKRAEARVRQSRDFLQTVIDGFPEQVMVINTNFTIALANQAAGRLVGKSASDLVGLPCFGISHDSSEPCRGKDHDCPLREVVKTKIHTTVEHIHLDATGKGHNIELVAAPIFDDRGEVVQIIESCRDITQRRAAEDAQRDLERQVQHAQKLESLGILAGGIAHDFNNILMGVLGNAELAMKSSPGSPVRGYLENIEAAAVRATDLAKQMLAYSGKGHFVVEAIHVNHMVTEMVHLLETTVSKTAVLEFDLSTDDPTLIGDSTQVRQVFMNLVTNASEAIGEDRGVISVRTGTVQVAKEDPYPSFGTENPSEGCFTFIEVQDTGCGMDPETRSKIFEPFFTTKFTGRGLGMAATLGIVRGHKGTLTVTSQLGKGTTIKVLFPSARAIGGDITPRAEDISEIDPWRGGGTILVVDDEEAVRDITAEILADQGFEVLVAEDGLDGLEVLGDDPGAVDLVLLDMTMPRMGGEETFFEMRKIRPDLPILLSSGYNEDEATKRFSGKGLAGFIQKPYRSSALHAKLTEILGKPPGG